MLGLRTTLLIPLGLFVLLWGAYTVAAGEHGQVAPGIVLGLLVLLLAATAANAEVFVLRPLGKLKQAVLNLAGNPLSGSPVQARSGELRELAEGIDQLRGRMQDHEAKLAQETNRRQALEQCVRELEDRYQLTVERANDGVWEWDLKTGAVEFSPRWKGMSGQSNAHLARIEDWRSLLHPDEREAVVLRLDNHVKGLTPHFDCEYRLRQGDGHYRWLCSRGTAIRHANGNPYRIVVMDNDIHARKQIEETLIQAAEGLSLVSGVDFYQALMRSLSSILGTRDNLVCCCIDDPPTRVRTLAYYSNGKFHENFEYDLAGTSCGAVIARGEIVYVPSGVCDIWPEEKQYDRDSYIGVPMFDSKGKLIGHFACMDGGAMRQDLPHLAIFRIFSVRAAAELERTLLLQERQAA